MTIRCNKLALATILFTVSFTALAQEENAPRPNGGGEWYYSIGGGDPYLGYNQSDKTNIDIGVSSRWSTLNACQFDPVASISDTFEDAQNSIYGLSNVVLNSATTALRSWGLSQIQQNHPGLYDFMTKGLQDAKESFELAVKSCRDYQRDIENGDNPINGWIKASRTSEWADASASGQNPSRTQETVDTTAANKGVSWVDGEMRGGENDEPINVIGDTISTGYEHVTSDGSSSSNGASGSSFQPRNISRVFASSEEARDWTTSVVGERTIRTCTTCTKLKVKVGQGLRLQQGKEKTEVIKQLNNLVYSQRVPTDSDLLSLSAPGMGLQITSEIVFALRNERESERQILMNRLSSEIALARVMEKALLARDLMNAGLQEPNITANDVARSEIGEASQRMSDEINNVLFEQQVRKEVFSQTAALIGSRDTLRNTASDASQALQQNQEGTEVRNGNIRNR